MIKCSVWIKEKVKELVERRPVRRLMQKTDLQL